MAEPIKPLRWFVRNTPRDKIQGPFDLVELASFLRAGDITKNTLTKAEAEDAWLPFQDRREFESARTMPADVIYRHLKDEAEENQSPWSLRGIYHFFGLIFGLMAYGLFSGIRPTWHIHSIQRVVLDALNWVYDIHSK